MDKSLDNAWKRVPGRTIGTGLAAAVAAAAFAAPPGAADGAADGATVGPVSSLEELDRDELRMQVLAEHGGKVREAIRRRSGQGVASIGAVVATRSPLTGTAVLVFKVTDRGGSRHQVVLDEFGRELAPDLMRRELEESSRLRGPVHPKLEQALRDAAPGESLPVLVWLRMPEEPPPDRPAFDAAVSPEALEAIETGARRRHEEKTRAESTRMVGRMAALGLASEPLAMAPMVGARLDAAGIAALAAMPEVLDISLDDRMVPMGNVQRAVIGGATVNGRGITGGGQKVGIIETGGRVATGHPWLTGHFQSTANTCLHDHAAIVAGVVDSTHAEYQGISTGTQLWIGGSCSGYSHQLQQAMNSAVAWGCRSLNLSLGGISSSPTAFSRFADGMVRNQRVTIVASAGNSGQQDPLWHHVMDPANAYNVIAVGNFEDRNTVQTGDDRMAPSSSWGDPASEFGDREKPELAAPGTDIRGLVNASPHINAHPGATGTSLAAPAVTAASALLMQRQSTLRTWPETVKAILMATAVQNIEGSSRLSGRDGAGGIRVDLADDVVRGIRGGSGGVSYTCAAPIIQTVATVPLVAGKRTRIVLCWSTDPNYPHYDSEPSADLDLDVRGPGGGIVAYSASFDNTYEIVEFTPTVAGTYQIDVYRFRCDGSPGYLGWAWWRAQ